MEQIRENTDGVPLFVEELTKTLLESGHLGEREDGFDLVGSVSDLAIPTTLQDSLMARLDRLGPTKEVAQLASVLGREFPLAWLEAISPLGSSLLQGELRRLRDAELLYQRGVASFAVLSFKHALIKDTAYRSLLRPTRQQYHRRIAETLVERFPDVPASQPELVAQHFTDAGQPADAIGYWLQAGVSSVGRSANLEAIEHLERGLSMLDQLESEAERLQRELALLTALGAALSVTRGYAAPEVERTFGRARELCRIVGETAPLVRVLLGLWHFYAVRTRLDEVLDIGETLIRIAEAADDSALAVEAHFALGSSQYYLGDVAASDEAFRRALELPDEDPNRRPDAVTIADARVGLRATAALAAWQRGFPDRALHHVEEALAISERISHPSSVAYSLIFAANLHVCRGEPERALERANQALTLSVEHGFFWAVVAGFFIGWSEERLGKCASGEGVERMRKAIAAYRRPGAELGQTQLYSRLIGTLLRQGRSHDAEAVLSEALEKAERSGEHFWDPELRRLKGEILVARGQENARAKADACFGEALELARQQGSRSLELRAAVSLFGLWRDTERHDPFEKLLRESYERFTEGFDTSDLTGARELLL